MCLGGGIRWRLGIAGLRDSCWLLAGKRSQLPQGYLKRPCGPRAPDWEDGHLGSDSSSALNSSVTSRGRSISDCMLSCTWGSQCIFFHLFLLEANYNIVVVFVIHWHESAMDLHIFPIPIPPLTSLSTRSLWVSPVHQARALVSCIQPAFLSLWLLRLWLRGS